MSRDGPVPLNARHGQAIALYIDRLKPLWARLAVAEEERVAFLGAREGVRAACSYRCIARARALCTPGPPDGTRYTVCFGVKPCWE